jgi:GalNAc-alpha-(1->4)-GalNAc-alpha-(1->3)-diNAcBac-PP-undecaprenol alpha-1,4-N-acetyl-D-galactosaminyltransferase
VLVLPAWYPTRAQPLSGPFVRDHVRAAARYGHRMVVLVDEGPSDRVGGLVALSEGRDRDLRIVRMTYRPKAVRLAGVLGALTVARRLSKEGTPVDLLHAHIHRMAWPAVLAGTVLRRPVVITENSSEWPRRLMTPAGLRRARLAFRRAALVCPVNERLQQAIESYGVHARFRIVPNTVETRVFRPPETSHDSDCIRLVNVALHVEVKGLDLLIRAFASVASTRPDLTLELIGEGPLTPSLKGLAEELGVGERVRFPGAAAPEEVADRLRASDVFVFSSLSENMPLAVLEALSCGLPVVATDVGGVPEAVGQDGALAPPGDADGLAHALEEVVSGFGRFDRTSIARRAAARWSFEAVGGVWDEIYRSLSPDSRTRR